MCTGTNKQSWILNLNKFCFHLPQQTSGGRRREQVSLEGSARLSSPLHLSGWQVGQMLKCPRLHLVVQSEESTNQMEPLQRRQRSWNSQRSRRSPAAQLFITHSGVRGLFFEEEEEEGGLARSATRETMTGRRWTLPSSCHFASTIGRVVSPAASKRKRKNWLDLLEEEAEEEKELWWWGEARRGGTVRRCLFFSGGTDESLLLLLSHSSVKKTIQLISLMSFRLFDKLCFSCFWFFQCQWFWVHRIKTTEITVVLHVK